MFMKYSFDILFHIYEYEIEIENHLLCSEGIDKNLYVLSIKAENPPIIMVLINWILHINSQGGKYMFIVIKKLYTFCIISYQLL